MIIFSSLCLKHARRFYDRDIENALANYLLWFFTVLFAFSVSRSFGHILKHLCYFAGYGHIWQHISPISGSLNTMTFVAIGAVTLFFGRMQTIMEGILKARQRLEKNSQELMKLYKEVEELTAERTTAELALKFAHEIRNPIMVIGGLVKRWQKKTLNEKERSQLDEILKQATHLEELVHSFERSRDFSHDKHFYPIELNALIASVLEKLASEAANKGITLLFDREPGSLFCLGNETMLVSGFTRAVQNAIETCPSGSIARISAQLKAKGISVVIEDNGPGIKAEFVEHIFDPFFSTEQGRLGWDFSILKDIVTKHKGKLSVQGSTDGTVVNIWLPLFINEAAACLTTDS